MHVDNDDELNVLTELNLEDGPEELENIGGIYQKPKCINFRLLWKIIIL